ncbi:saccharopine dehydrogenase NADP-binding domain-containing protein [Stenotrophomonas sp. Y6]|uniref:saccharopine dehydrogenase family protein n=1 Tax=Stenotrophomonas sp. Y6 TaxID=2920383 RepID=UPI001F060872|nr:saccharopine dehydrogenase NADP-binding domain-containing protein [Stenotrophomonas sp. Y6]MCH1910003.1 saccharopine dehydrogenase NADP-binding domain-containing protein [Stenotrophomonas sp. Y6]
MSQQEGCRVVVLGGYGHFGARIVRALAATPGITVIAAGRHPQRAAANLPGMEMAPVQCRRLDTAAATFADDLRATGADLVIHTAGPFQGQDYGVARACLEAGMHYIDLADGRDFVRDFPAQLDAVARRHGRSAISGASTLPALSGAVVDALRGRLDVLQSIDIVIAPAQATPLGMATVRAVLSYCGQSFRCWIDGRWQPVVGWADPQPVTFARIAPRLASPCDVPDHDLLVQRHPGVSTVRFRAALELPLLSRCLAALAWLRHRGVPLPMAALAGAFARAGRCFDRFGTDLGGMRVTLRGQRGGVAHRVHWDLTAPMLHGPEIPTFAAVLLARRLARGEPLPVGAQACLGLLDLPEFEAEFARWQIDSQVS